MSLRELARTYLLVAAVITGVNAVMLTGASRLGIVELWPGGGLAQRTAKLESTASALTTEVKTHERLSEDSDRALSLRIARLDSTVQAGSRDREQMRRSIEALLWFNCVNATDGRPEFVRALCRRVMDQ